MTNRGSVRAAADCDWMSGERRASPEEALLMAVFHRAVLDACLVVEGHKKGQENNLTRVKPDDRRTAEAYLFNANYEPGNPFGLQAVADYLGVDVEAMRFRLRGLVTSGRASFKKINSVRNFGGGQKASADVLLEVARGQRPERHWVQKLEWELGKASSGVPGGPDLALGEPGEDGEFLHVLVGHAACDPLPDGRVADV